MSLDQYRANQFLSRLTEVKSVRRGHEPPSDEEKRTQDSFGPKNWRQETWVGKQEGHIHPHRDNLHHDVRKKLDQRKQQQSANYRLPAERYVNSDMNGPLPSRERNGMPSAIRHQRAADVDALEKMRLRGVRDRLLRTTRGTNDRVMTELRGQDVGQHNSHVLERHVGEQARNWDDMVNVTDRRSTPFRTARNFRYHGQRRQDVR